MRGNNGQLYAKIQAKKISHYGDVVHAITHIQLNVINAHTKSILPIRLAVLVIQVVIISLKHRHLAVAHQTMLAQYSVIRPLKRISASAIIQFNIIRVHSV